VFIKAAQAAGHPPSRCIVIEDAVVGVEAALASGATVLAVTTTRAAADLKMAHRVVASLESLTAADLETLVQTRC
ncbi:MAG: HAD family phosphatase, partial [Verrucomicrobia bacterium]|nr:HAD family phosphatase [Verrucomicrobiota bacterium]